MKIGILREGKTPPDKRVPFSPEQCEEIIKKNNVELVVQPSSIRSFSDAEYVEKGIQLQEDLSDCEVLMGVKEVKIKDLIPGKRYFFFSHTLKKQPYNSDLMKALLQKNISMTDYETLTHENGGRILGFGRYAGIVGTYNGLLAWGKRNNSFDLKPAHLCSGINELKQELEKVALGEAKIIITGGGRVAKGALEIMNSLGLQKVDAQDFLFQNYSESVFTQLDCKDYYHHKDAHKFEQQHFFDHPSEYKSKFKKYTSVADIFISCHYWDNNSAPLFTLEDVQEEEFNIKVIADITCDICGSIPTTIRPSTIADPIYGYNPETEKEGSPYGNSNITVMAVDNLPCELPRDASTDFGKALMEHILPALIKDDPTKIISRATMTKNGDLTENYKYLSDYAGI